VTDLPPARRAWTPNAWTISLSAALSLVILCFAAWFTITDYVDKTVAREISARMAVLTVSDTALDRRLESIDHRLDLIAGKIDDLLQNSHTHGS